jgi:hypothetical protein
MAFLDPFRYSFPLSCNATYNYKLSCNETYNYKLSLNTTYLMLGFPSLMSADLIQSTGDSSQEEGAEPKGAEPRQASSTLNLERNRQDGPAQTKRNP